MGKEPEYSYSDLLDKIEAGLVQDVTIQGTELHGHLKATPKEQFHTTIPANTDSLTKELHAANVNFTLKDPQSNLLLPILFNVGPFVLIGAIWFFMLRQMQSGRQQGAVVRQEPRPPALDAAEEGHVQGCGRRG